MQNCFPFSLRGCLECLQGPSFTATASYAHLDEDQTDVVRLDVNNMGTDTVLLKSGTRICGSGGALATAPIMQNKAYFEVKLQQGGRWGLGLATRSADLSTLPITKNAWFIQHDGRLMADGKEVGKLGEDVNALNEGDLVGVAFDHVELKFYCNGTPLPLCISEVKTSSSPLQQLLYPMLFVDNDAILDVKFSAIIPPAGYDVIMIEKTLL